MNVVLDKLINKTTQTNQLESLGVITWKTIPSSISGGLSRKIIEKFKFKNEVLGDMFISSRKDEIGGNYFTTEVKNKLGKVFGDELYSIDEKNMNMIGFNIKVNPEYRQKKMFRFGEVLRLATVMEMIENKSPHIKIVSKDTAIYFHSKYKFVPNFIEFKKRDKLLQDILKEQSPEFLSLKKEAQSLIELVEKNKNDAEIQRQLTKKTNDLVRRYIDLALKSKNPQKEHPLSEPIEMILTKENVLKNKDFFNSLLKKYGIDYKI